jgi:hypothetical protein
MKYSITAKVRLENGSSVKTTTFSVESENPLSVEQIKEQCFQKLEPSLKNYTKKEEQIWQRGVPLKEPNLDTDVFDKSYQHNPLYVLVVTKK